MSDWGIAMYEENIMTSSKLPAKQMKETILLAYKSRSEETRSLDGWKSIGELNN